MKNIRFLIIIFLFITSLFALSIIAVYIKGIEGEKISIVDGLYWVISTVTTVGYGDIVFKSDLGRIFSIFVQLFGIGFIFGIAFPYLIIPWVEKRFLLSLPDEIDMERHIVIFGYTNLTPFLCDQLENLRMRYVIVENDRDAVVKALEDGYNVIYSDLSENVIERAKINSCLAVIIMWDDVEKSLDALLTLRDIEQHKYAVLSDPFYSKYLHYAGAKRVITPKSVVGSYLAKVIIEKHKGILDIRELLPEHGVTQIITPKGSKIIGLTKGEIEENFDVRIIAICEFGKMNFNPERSFKIKSGHVLLVFGERLNLIKFYEEVNR